MGTPGGVLKSTRMTTEKNENFCVFFGKQIFFENKVFLGLFGVERRTEHCTVIRTRRDTFVSEVFFNSSYDFWGPLGVLKNLPE